MSRGFVNEDDQEEVPFIAPRADLPVGEINYVTQIGMDELLEERDIFIYEREHLENSNEKDKRITTNFLNAKIQLLNERISSAQIIDLEKQPKDEVRFGAYVTLKFEDQSKPQKYQIVGVDEANISKGKISFISPIAKLLTNRKVGEQAVLKLADRERLFEIVDITYI